MKTTATNRIGAPVCGALVAFAEARYADTVAALFPIRATAHRFGSSNAQRDILTQTLFEAALRDDQIGLAGNLINERAVHKPESPLTRRPGAKLARCSGAAARCRTPATEERNRHNQHCTS